MFGVWWVNEDGIVDNDNAVSEPIWTHAASLITYFCAPLSKPLYVPFQSCNNPFLWFSSTRCIHSWGKDPKSWIDGISHSSDLPLTPQYWHVQFRASLVFRCNIYPEESYHAHSGHDTEVFLHHIHSPHLQCVMVDRGGCSKLIEALTHLVQPESSMCSTAGRH